ncbi:hypothetical protein Q4Q39_04650 [Flavivirga amylovorans]|uniref:Uncharacterized protein n=1 Tax=Flavivirga amylovorans TaxID=870486 RepID=A0ABT8WYE3_9FLAO|nr:hypothetical protein [Flavivirga amylovorans]MDO5986691.1 hypothetical protein [Flavivirga amylovorans]
MEKQEKDIKKAVLKVFILIIAILAPIIYYQENDVDRVKKEYEKIKNEEYYGHVIKKKEDGDYLRASRYIFLKDYRKIYVSNDLYSRISVDDSVSKVKGCDSIYFYLKSGEIVIEDNNEFKREKYFNLLEKKKE